MEKISWSEKIFFQIQCAELSISNKKVKWKIFKMAEECPVLKDGKQEVDIYRDTPVRLLGYANEVGEAFRALVSVKFVYASYGVASAYVLADTYDKASKVHWLFYMAQNAFFVANEACGAKNCNERSRFRVILSLLDFSYSIDVNRYAPISSHFFGFHAQ